MSWSQTNKFPHHTFQWEGIDGTRIDQTDTSLARHGAT
ncbi:hypothetical protein ABZ372_32190, partial [Streptomyces sp. NPDC005921]